MGSEKNQWMLWVIVIGVVIITLIAFNYHGDKSDSIPLSEIFPEEMGTQEGQNIEYEFVDSKPAQTQAAAPALAGGKLVLAKPAVSKAVAVPAAPAKTSPAVPAAAPVTVSPSTRGDYSIQVLSSKDKAATEKSLERIKAKGHAAYLVTRDLGEKGIWYRVNIGPFETKQQAEAYLPKIQADYKSSFVISGKKE